MEKILIIVVEICAFGLSALSFYHFFNTRDDGFLAVMAIIFFFIGIWAHVIHKDTKLFSNE